MKNTVKIFLSYHANAVRLVNEVLTPIHVGRETALEEVKEKLSDIIGDNTGENISEKNKNYCELTAQYWAWKNYKDIGAPDYIGFMHYRRHLSFNLERRFDDNRWGVISRKCLDEDYMRDFCLDSKSIEKAVEDYDIVTVNPWDVTNAGSKDNYDHYKSSDSKIFIKDYDEALKILVDKYPEYAESVEIYNKQSKGYYTNIFVMRKEIFFDYCEYLFSILFELEKRLDISGYNKQEARVFGYISEWLFGIYVTQKIKEKKKVLELQRTFLEDTSVPLKETDRVDIPVIFSSDDNYAQHLGVAIHSLVKNRLPGDFLKIYIIDGGISVENKDKIGKIVKDDNHVVVDYLKLDLSRFDGFFVKGGKHISVATFYRYLIPELVNEDKIVYLDCDLVVQSSLRDLYAIDVSNDYFGGVIDILVEENTNRLFLDKYCNAGVLLLNCKKLRDENMPQRLMDYTRDNINNIVWGDQDVLNKVLQDGIQYIDKKWNAQSCEYEGSYKSGFNDVALTANIIHFISDRKPWLFDNYSPMRHEYYRYLKETPWSGFYYTYRYERLKFKLAKYKDEFFRKHGDSGSADVAVNPVKTAPKTFVRKPEGHAIWFFDSVAKGDFTSAEQWVYLPKGIDKRAFALTVKKTLEDQKSQVDAGGGVKRVNLVDITAKLSVELNNASKPVEHHVTMIKTGAEEYKVSIAKVPEKIIRKPEGHAAWFINQVSSGDFNSVKPWVNVPKGQEVDAFFTAVKDKLALQKADFDASGGIERVNLVDITAKLSIKLKNSEKPVECAVTMIKTGAEEYKIVMPDN